MDSSSSLAQAKQLIDQLDLSAILNRLVQVEQWTFSEALSACQQYKNYLFLQKKYAGQYELPPSRDIDEVWHAHILHTLDYLEFCQKVFSGWLHHHPHHGKNNSISTQQLEALFENNTQRLYFAEFGEYIYSIRESYIKTKFNRFLSLLKGFKKTVREVET